MNLQVLYDLKEWLEHAAIAGTALLQEDFRLRRVVEALAPLAKANPVFAKISTGTMALLNAPETERSTKLLDVLSLVDAVVYTQGVSNIAGEISSLNRSLGKYVQISYSELQPLLTALRGGGTGRTALINGIWEAHPEYFSDFRVLPHVVAALGDNYAELADLISDILINQGESVIPLLKEGFEADGKVEMARRVRLIANLAGEKENAWYVSVLPHSKKEVRQALIQVLSLSQDNAKILLDLCQSERGKLRDTALRSLASMQNDECIDYFRKEIGKKPNTAWCLTGVTTQWASDLTAQAVKKYLLTILENPSCYDYTKQEQLMQFCSAISGKYSENIKEFWLWVAESIDDFSKITAINRHDSIAVILQNCFIGTILCNSSSEIFALARELCALKPRWFLCSQFLSDLICCSPESVYDRYGKYIIHEKLWMKESEDQQNTRVQLMMIFALVAWQKKYGGYTVPVINVDVFTEKIRIRYQPIPGLDRRWIEHLASHDIVQPCSLCAFHPKLFLISRESTCERILMNLIDTSDPRMCQICGTYYHRRAKITGQLEEYLDVLIRCGWKDWQGLLVHCAQKQSQIRFYQVLEQLNRLPISNQEKAHELKSLDAMVKAGRISVGNRIWPEQQIETLIATLESDPNTEL